MNRKDIEKEIIKINKEDVQKEVINTLMTMLFKLKITSPMKYRKLELEYLTLIVMLDKISELHADIFNKDYNSYLNNDEIEKYFNKKNVP